MSASSARLRLQRDRSSYASSATGLIVEQGPGLLEVLGRLVEVVVAVLYPGVPPKKLQLVSARRIDAARPRVAVQVGVGGTDRDGVTQGCVDGLAEFCNTGQRGPLSG